MSRFSEPWILQITCYARILKSWFSQVTYLLSSNPQPSNPWIFVLMYNERTRLNVKNWGTLDNNKFRILWQVVFKGKQPLSHANVNPVKSSVLDPYSNSIFIVYIFTVRCFNIRAISDRMVLIQNTISVTLGDPYS